MINIKSDSRKVKKGDIFVALKGINSQGKDYIKSAIIAGASKIIVDDDSKYDVDTIKVNDTREYLNKYLRDNYKKYLDEMNIIGITGTNGKTTTAYLIYQALNKLNKKCAYIGTIGYYLNEKVCSLPNSTVDVCDLYEMIINAYDNGYKNIIMEVTSQGICMGRITGIDFDYAIFTNLTQDHLDYHKTMENYAMAKKQLFCQLKDTGTSIINDDDDYKNYYKTDKSICYGFSAKDIKIVDLNLGYNSTFILNVKGVLKEFKTNLIGKYNIYNLTCAITLLIEMGITINDISNITEELLSPPGRMEIINYLKNLIIIDYAHTPDAMENIYKTVDEIKEGKIYTVFGCTGDRDKTKRPIMFDIANKNSDYVIVTSDDLHDEDFSSILKDILENNKYMNYEVIEDRGKAISKGIHLLNDKDILLILGKGHEEFIIIKNDKIPFNDKKVVLGIIEKEIIYN